MSQYYTFTIELPTYSPPPPVTEWENEHADGIKRSDQFGKSLVYLVDLSRLYDGEQSGDEIARRTAEDILSLPLGLDRVCYFVTNDTGDSGWARLYVLKDESVRIVDEIDGQRGACGQDVRQTLQTDYDFAAYSQYELSMGPAWAE